MSTLSPPPGMVPLEDPQTEPPSPPDPDRARLRARPRWFPVVELLGLLAAPPALFVALGIRPMAPTDMIDPWFYTAYATHPRDLMFRYGPKYYFWVRLGAIIPEHLSSLAFGPVAGFFVLREVLAVLAAGGAYALLRRMHSRGAGIVAAALVLTNPVMLTAWGTDYPDAVAVSCLAVATVCAAMPTSDANRWRWLVGSAFAGGLAVHCQVVSLPFVLAILIAHVVVHRRGGVTDLARAGNAFLGVLVLQTVVLSLVAQRWFHEGNILGPTFDQLRDTQQATHTPNLLHTEGINWLPHVPYLLIPPAVLIAWTVVWSASSDRVRPAEHVVAWTAGLQWAFAVVLQFSGRQPVLEYHLYSSMLWPSLLLLLAVTVTRWARRETSDDPRVHRAQLALAAVVVLLPVVPRYVHSIPTFPWFPTGLALITAAMLPLLAASWAREARPLTCAAGAGLALCLLFPLSVAPLGTVRSRHANLPRGRYNLVFVPGGWSQVDWYGALTQLPDVIGRSDTRGGPVLFTWWDGSTSSGLAWASGQYLWHKHSLSTKLPVLHTGDLRKLVQQRPTQMALLGVDDSEFPAAVAALRHARMQPVVVKDVTIRYGGVSLVVELLRLDRFATTG